MKFTELNELANNCTRLSSIKNDSRVTDLPMKLQAALYQMGASVNFKDEKQKQDYQEFVDCYSVVNEITMVPEFVKQAKAGFENSMVQTKENTMVL